MSDMFTTEQASMARLRTDHPVPQHQPRCHFPSRLPVYDHLIDMLAALYWTRKPAMAHWRVCAWNASAIRALGSRARPHVSALRRANLSKATTPSCANSCTFPSMRRFCL